MFISVEKLTRSSWKKGLAALLVTAGAVLLIGCSAGNSGNPGSTAGTPSSGVQQDAAKQDGAAQSDKGGQATGGSGFREYPIGDEKEVEGMKVGMVYFQAVHMEPVEKAGLKPDQADIHLEADIAALKDNKVGFGAGEFIPYLSVHYKLKNLDNGQEQQGSFMPMNAGDGAHYGANVKMMGAGNYKVALTIESPLKQDYLLHVDKETGVEGRFWTKPLELEWTFPWMPKK